MSPEIPKSIKSFCSESELRTTFCDDVIVTDKTSKTSTAVWWPESINENKTFETVFDKLFRKIFFDFRFKICSFLVWLIVTISPITFSKRNIFLQIFYVITHVSNYLWAIFQRFWIAETAFNLDDPYSGLHEKPIAPFPWASVAPKNMPRGFLATLVTKVHFSQMSKM